MITKVVGPHIENEGYDNENRVFLVVVQDDETGDIRSRLQHYDNHNSLVECTGFVIGPVTRDGSTVIGHRLVRVSKSQQEYIHSIIDILDPRPEL
jgi:hypothetical protein